MNFRFLLRTRCSLVFTACLAACSLLACTDATGAESLPGYVVLPLVPMGRTNQATLRVKINDVSTMLVVDTGAPFIALDRQLYTAAHVRSNNAAPGQLPPEVGKKFKANDSVSAEVGYIDSLKAGAADLGKHPVAVLDMGSQFAHFNNLHGSTAVGGLLGEDVLNQFSAIIDWRRRGVYFNTDPSKRMKLGAGLVASGWTAVPMSRTNGHHFTVQCNIGGKSARLLVDTGASFTCFAPGIVPVTMLYSSDTTHFSHIGTNAGTMTMIGGDSTMHPGRVEHWKIGDYEIASSVVAVNALPKTLLGEQGDGDGPMLGLLGCEMLAANNAIVDIGGHTLYLKHSGR